MKRSRALSWLVLAAVTLTGPLGPLSAAAQAPPPPTAPPGPTQPPPAQIQPPPPAPMQPPPPAPPPGPPAQFHPAPMPQTDVWGDPSATSLEPTQGDAIGAGFLNVVYVPGKAILCGAGAVMATFMMLVTFGTAYPTASGLFREGCHGTWVLTPEHVSGKIPSDWERTDGYQTYYPHGGIYP